MFAKIAWGDCSNVLIRGKYVALIARQPVKAITPTFVGVVSILAILGGFLNAL